MNDSVERDLEPMVLAFEPVCLQIYQRLVAGFRAFGLDQEDAEVTAQDALAKLADAWSKRRPEQRGGLR